MNDLRKTTQFLIPEQVKPTEAGSYDIYPGFKVTDGAIQTGYQELATYIKQHKTVIIDGYAGVFWTEIVQNLSTILKKENLQTMWYNISAAMKDGEEIDEMIAPFLGGDDPIFGYRTTLFLKDFFRTDLLPLFRPDEEADINIIYGPGASLSGWDAPVIYVDLPKNELQFRMRAGKIFNLGATQHYSNKAMYKRFYFVDWVVLNRHKQELSDRIDIIIDSQRPELPFWTTGETLRQSLKQMSENFFRVRPWFEPGPWGGHFMKEHFPQLNKDVPNYAWSFELIVPENGLMLEENGKMLEVSFDFLMFQQHKNVLGDAADRFGVEFPIRFDYLDTFDGGNLSVQVHPQQEYFVKEFGEKFTQDECYYILETKDDADVYLGFQDTIQPEQFRRELEQSFRDNTPVAIDKHVRKMKAHKHDLFLIPNGTIHGSGKNNLVLEISSTPYIFTFKLYDWLRLDLEGNPRPLNIERGFKNLNFNRKGEKITKEHVSKPYLIAQGDGWQHFHVPTHKEHFYDVHRYEFSGSIEIQTNNQCHVMVLVEGTSVILETKQGLRQRFNYAETFVVPAACKSYRLINEDKRPCKVVKAFVKQINMNHNDI